MIKPLVISSLVLLLPVDLRGDRASKCAKEVAASVQAMQKDTNMRRIYRMQIVLLAQISGDTLENAQNATLKGLMEACLEDKTKSGELGASR